MYKEVNYSGLSDQELLRKLSDGDDAAFTCLFRRHWNRLYKSAYRVLADEQVCEDIVQAVFMNIWERRNELSSVRSFESYVYVMTRYMVFRHVAESRRWNSVADFPEDEPAVPSADTSLHVLEMETIVSSTVRDMPLRCQEVFTLSRDEQLSRREIAEQLGISLKTVENHMSRALRLLRISLRGMLMAGLIFALSAIWF